MSVESAIYTRLKAVAGVTSLVGSGDNARIYPDVAPPSASLPRITFQVVTGNHEHHMTAASGLVESVIQIDCWASSSSGRGALRSAVRLAMDGAVGATWGSESIRAVMLESDRSTLDAPDDGSEIGTYRASMDFRIWYTESVPTF